MSQHELYLLGKRRFLPLFITQLLGAFNDNLFKAGLATLITFKIAAELQLDSQILVPAAGGVFILPFFLFSATAGQIAEKYEKSKLIQYTKILEIALTVLAAIGFYFNNVWFLFAVLFLLGTQSTFFGPLKYSILPTHLAESELIGGNGLIGMGTFVSILIGTITGNMLTTAPNGEVWVSAILISLAITGWLASRFIPNALPDSQDLLIKLNPITQTWKIIHHAARQRLVFLPMLGISWFWLVGATYITLFYSYAKDDVGGNEQVSTLFLTAFTLGIAIGAMACNRLVKGEITAKYVPLAALGMSVFAVDLYFASQQLSPVRGELLNAAEFMQTANHWRILIDMLLFSISAGIYIVPLYSLIQNRSQPSHRSRNIAALNILNALFMVISAIAATLMSKYGLSIPEIFLTLAILNGFVGLYICRLLPQAVIKILLRRLFRLVYGVRINGLENYNQAGKRAVIVVNHTSYLDGLLIGAFLPDIPTAAINTFVAQRWWAKPAIKLFNILTVDPTNPMTVKTMIRHVKEDNKLIIFPEGRISVTGALMKVFEGPGTIAYLADADLVPIRIDGALYTPFSRVRGKHPIKWRPRITITVLPPRRFDIPPELRGRARRQLIGAKLYDLMSEMIFVTSKTQYTLFKSLLYAKQLFGGSKIAVEGIERDPINYRKLIRNAFVLGRRLAKHSESSKPVGILLPSSTAAASTLFAALAYRRIPAMLNFSVGLKNILATCEAVALTTVITSRRFIALAKLGEVVAELEQRYQIIYLEDLAQTLSFADKVFGLLAVLTPNALYKSTARKASVNDTAVILFTSGSEGVPKGVALSHANLQSNRYQLSARIDFYPADTVFNALPLFHSFGLTGGLLLPLLSGVKVFLYPSPLHYRIVPQLVYETNSTIMFGTDTFLAGYARRAHPYDFYSVRYIFAGAEKVKAETRKTYAEKFGVRILEGYGTTETSPVLAVNTAMQNKANTVGRFLPGIQYRLLPVAGVDCEDCECGRLMVLGPNIMQGYIKLEQPGDLQAPAEGWYDTGDIVKIDNNGYISIIGRVKRFAKVAGEMISLNAVEMFIDEVWPEFRHAVLAQSDERKGEQLILFSTYPQAERKALQAYAKQQGIGELMVPKQVKVVQSIPVLGTGKTDYVSLAKLITDEP